MDLGRARDRYGRPVNVGPDRGKARVIQTAPGRRPRRLNDDRYLFEISYLLKWRELLTLLPRHGSLFLPWGFLPSHSPHTLIIVPNLQPGEIFGCLVPIRYVHFPPILTSDNVPNITILPLPITSDSVVITQWQMWYFCISVESILRNAREIHYFHSKVNLEVWCLTQGNFRRAELFRVMAVLYCDRIRPKHSNIRLFIPHNNSGSISRRLYGSVTIDRVFRGITGWIRRGEAQVISGIMASRDWIVKAALKPLNLGVHDMMHSDNISFPVHIPVRYTNLLWWATGIIKLGTVISSSK